MDPTADQMISVSLVFGLMMLSAVRGMLDRTGLIAAAIVGLSVSLFGHWTWLTILISFLAVGSLATLWKYEEKAALRLAEDNKGARGWRNVMANGGVASLVAIANFTLDQPEWSYLAACASISVAASDTLASEIGSLDPRTRSIINLEAVPAGTNGGMSVTGTFAALGGAALIAFLSVSLSSITDVEIPLLTIFVVITLIGWLGCQVDSILGALFENKGLIGKHSVNFLATLSGALMAIIFHTRFL